MNKITDFYDNKTTEYQQNVINSKNGYTNNLSLFLPKNDILRGEIPENVLNELSILIEKLYTSLRTYNYEYNGYNYVFEIGKLESEKQNAKTENIIKFATYQSSLSGNVGNGFEVAVDSYLNPQNNYYYIASMGMGMSRAISPKEQRYLAKEGRLLFDNDGKSRPLPVIEALARTLDIAEIGADRLYSDSAGALYSLALGTVYGEGKLKSTQQNVRPGFRDMSTYELAINSIIIDRKTSKIQEQESDDALKIQASTLEFARQSRGNAFTSRNIKPKKSLAMLGSYALGLAKGLNDEKHRDPLLKDNIAFASCNPNADIVFTIGGIDPITSSSELNDRIANIAKNISEKADNKVLFATIDGASHNLRTHHPQFLNLLSNTLLSL